MKKNRMLEIAAICFVAELPVGAEVGFSQRGAGALGSAALLSLTPLEPRRWSHGHRLWLCRLAHRQRRALVLARLQSELLFTS